MPQLLLLGFLAVALVVLLPERLQPSPASARAASPLHVAHAQPRQTPRSHPAQAAADLPVNLELVVIIERLSALRKTPEGRAASELLRLAGLSATLERSWQMLAERLNLTPAEAVDRLLGRRIVLTVRDPAADGDGNAKAGSDRRWALLSEIDDDTAQLLRTNLDVAPRTVLKGQQVYAVEGGNLDLALHRRGADQVTLLLGPSDAPDLLNDLILAVLRPLPDKRTMSRSPVLEESRRLGQADVVVLGRVDPPPELDRPDAPHWDNFVVLNLRREPGDAPAGRAGAAAAVGGFDARIVLRDASTWPRLAGLRAWSDAPVRNAAPAALAAIVEATPAGMPPPDPAGGSLLAILDRIAPPAAITSRLTGRRALFIHQKGGEIGRPRGLTIAVGAELTDVAAAAPAVDQFLAERIGDAERLFGSSAPPPAVSPGAPPRAARVEVLRVPQGGPLGDLVGGQPAVAWTFRRDEEASASGGSAGGPGLIAVRGEGQGVAAGGGGAQGEGGGQTAHAPGDGWCVAAIAAADADPAAAAQHAASLLVLDAEDAAEKRWLSVGQIQPAAVVDAIGPGPWLSRISDVARRIGRVEWRLELTNLLDVEGEAALRFAEPPPR